MEPKKENIILSYLTFSFLLIFMAVISILFYIGIQDQKTSNDIEPFHIPKVNVLTSEEVEAEKRKLFENSSRPVVISQTNSKDIVSPVESEEQISVIKSELVKDSYLPDVTNTYGPITDQKVIDQIRSTQVYVSPDSNIEMKLVTAENLGERILKRAKGVIYSQKNGTIILSQENNLGFININVLDKTQVTVNGKLLLASDLKVGDKLSVEGFGFEGFNEIDAEVIHLTGTIEILPLY